MRGEAKLGLLIFLKSRFNRVTVIRGRDGDTHPLLFPLKKINISEVPPLHRSLVCQSQLFLHPKSLLHQFHFSCVLRVQSAPKAELLQHLEPKFHLSIISRDLAPPIPAANRTGPLPSPFGAWHPHMATALSSSRTFLATLI